MKFKEFLNEANTLKLSEFIVDACREIKISIRSIECKEGILSVRYNYDKEAPTGFRTDKNDIVADIKSEVKDILGEQDIEIKQVLRSNESSGVALLQFVLKDAKIIIS